MDTLVTVADAGFEFGHSEQSSALKPKCLGQFSYYPKIKYDSLCSVMLWLRGEKTRRLKQRFILQIKHLSI